MGWKNRAAEGEGSPPLMDEVDGGSNQDCC